VNDQTQIKVAGKVKITDITDPDNPTIIVEKNNAIHQENFSEALAMAIAGYPTGKIFQMAFGNGAASVDATGLITYLPPNVVGQNAQLYNQTYQKIVDGNLLFNTDPTRNRMTISHQPGKPYTDIYVLCTIDFGEPEGQPAFDNMTGMENEYTFDELGLKAFWGTDSSNNVVTRLLSHVVFHPVSKALNTKLQVEYTVRISTLNSLIG
jgi:hypothetical protein